MILLNSTIKIITGPAGTGKTYNSCRHAINSLKKHNFKRIVVTRPVVHVDEDLGFLPGNINEKMHPWLLPITDYLHDFDFHFTDSNFEICPLAYMRGRTFHDTFIIADEMQNSSINQFKMLLTRLGQNSHLSINGDLDQSDIENNGLKDFLHKLHNSDRCYLNIHHFKLNNDHIKRDDIVKDVLDIYTN